VIPVRRNPAAMIAMLALLGTGISFGGGSGRPDFEPPLPLPPPRPPSPEEMARLNARIADISPNPPARSHRPVFTAKQKASRAKRKAQRKARKR